MPKKLITIYQTLKKAYGSQHWWPAESPFEVVVGAILTQNTSWTNVERVISRLKEKNLLSAKRMSKFPVKALARCLRPAGYFNVKTRRLKNFLIFLTEEYGGNLKHLFTEPLAVLRQKLLDVNGIGPETADSIILYAAGKPIFVVDGYTRRAFSKLGLLKASASYHETQSYFMNNLPLNVKLFNEFHALIVEHAKRFCKTRPICGPCPLRSGCVYGRMHHTRTGSS